MTSEYLWPFKEDVTRFDFEVDGEDESMCEAMAGGVLKGLGASRESGSDAER